jgi:ribosomal protein S6--L-glutamate ligase
MSASVKGGELHENQRLVDEVTALGHEAEIINYRQTAVAITEEGRVLYGYGPGDKLAQIQVDAVIPRIGKFVESGSMVLRMLVANGVYSTATPEAVEIAKNKMNSLTLLDASGIPVPFSIAPAGTRPENPTETLKLIQPDSSGPVILKTLRGSHGNGVVLAESRRSAKSSAQTFRAIPTSYLIQEFAEAPEEENLASDVRLIVINGRVVAAMKRRARDEGEFRSNLSQGGTGEPYEATPRVTELAVKACEVLGVRVGGVDIIPSRRGPLVNEVDVTPDFGVEQVTGVNVARLIAEFSVRRDRPQSADPAPRDAGFRQSCSKR